MAGWFENGTVADIVIAVMVVEGLLLVALRSRVRHMQVTDVVGMLAAGLCLVLALRASMTGAGWQWIAVFLTAAFAAHLLDLRRQLRERP